MFEAYKIGVKISLLNNVSSGLVAISAEFMGLNKHVSSANTGLALMEAKLASIKRLGLIGGALAGAGFGMLFSLKGPIEHAMEWEREAAKMRQMGLGDWQVKEAQKFVQANDVIGTSIQQRMRLFVEAQGAFRESGMGGRSALDAAKTMMPILAGYETASKLLSGPHQLAAVGAMRNLNKTVEIMGGLGDTAKATAIADGIFKAAQSSGKMVDERQLKQFVAYGSSATNSLSMRSIFGGLEPIIGEFGGSTVATGLRTAFTRMSGGMALPPKKMQTTLGELGIGQLDHGQVRMSDGLLRLMQSDTVSFTKQMMETYKAHGIESQLDRERTNALLFNTTGAKIYNKLMQQMPVIEESLKSYDAAKGITQTLRSEKDGPMMAVEKFHTALADLGLVIGQTVLPVLTPMIQSLTTFFKWLKEYPTVLKELTIGFFGLGTAMAIGGTVTLLKAGFNGIGLVLRAGGGMPGLLDRTATSLGSLATMAGYFAAAYAGWKLGEMAGDKIDQSIQKSSGGAHGSLRSWLDQTSFGQTTGWFKYGQDEALHFVKAPSSVLNNSGSHFVAGKIDQPINVTVVSKLNDREIARAVTKVQGREGARPPTGGSSFDGSMAPAPVGAGATGGW